MERRSFLRAVTAGTGAVAVTGGLWHAAATPAAAAVTDSPYGPLLAPDANGLALPRGFTGRVVARSTRPVAGLTWHGAPDGGACFADGDGWIYVSNSELPLIGGASALRFGPDGTVTAARRILSGTNLNCAGGATPWHTWLSCEETYRGRVYETDPYGNRSATSYGAMGRFKHEAAACDPDRRVVYLTEEEDDGCFYRFTPTSWGGWGALSEGRLDVLCDAGGGAVEWREVPDPDAPWPWDQTRTQVDEALHFDGGEGCYYSPQAGVCYFTTKGDNRVWGYDAAANTLAVVYDADEPLGTVDNITGRAGGDLYVAEDGGNMEINIITPAGTVAPVVRIDGHPESEITGPAFSPDGSRLYFSSQRGESGFAAGTDGVTYEVHGPFRA